MLPILVSEDRWLERSIAARIGRTSFRYYKKWQKPTRSYFLQTVQRLMAAMETSFTQSGQRPEAHCATFKEMNCARLISEASTFQSNLSHRRYREIVG